MFCQIAGVPPQSDDFLDNIADQLEGIFRGRVITIQMVEKLDMRSNARKRKQQNGKLRFHVVKSRESFKMITRFTLQVRAESRASGSAYACV